MTLGTSLGEVGYGAKKGQQIKGNLYRGKKGQFASGPQQVADAVKAQKAAKDKGYPEGESFADWGLEKEDQKYLDALWTDKTTQIPPKAFDRLVEMGILTKSGGFTGEGKRLTRAMRNGDKATVYDMMKKGGFKGIKEPKAAKAPAAKKAAAGKAPAKQASNVTPQQSADQKRFEAQTKVISAVKDYPGLKDIQAVSGGGKPSAANLKQLQADGLVDKDGKLTGKGKALLELMSRGNAGAVKAYLAKLKESGQMTVQIDPAALEEAKTKRVSGRTHVAGDFLVVEDPDNPSTWHLPVKVNGVVNPRLMGAAWAALFGGGFRGQKYAGPDIAGAKRKLKALYTREKRAFPSESEEAAQEVEEIVAVMLREGEAPAFLGVPVEEFYTVESPHDYYFGNPKNFSDLDKSRQAAKKSEEMRTLFGDYKMLLNGVFYDPQVADKGGAIRDLTEEFTRRMDKLSGEIDKPPAMSEEAPAPDDYPDEDRHEFAESMAGVMSLEEAEGEVQDDLVYMNVRLIKAGWGNQRDNFFYPGDVLRRDAKKFVGAKMYITGHNEDQKDDERHWVSTVQSIADYEADGSPIARVAVHDPYFAKRVRNLEKAGLLHKVECSIKGEGAATPYEESARKGFKVAAILKGGDVDWVRKAGAGGQALALAESETGETPMEDENKTEQPTEGETPAAGEQDAKPTPDETKQAAQAPAQEEQQETPVLESAAVRAKLAQANLPGASVLRLEEGQYATEEALDQAIVAERAYVKSLTGSGKPSGMGNTQSNAGAPVKLNEAAINEQKDAVVKELMGI